MNDLSLMPENLRGRFWYAIEKSPYIMLQLDGDPVSLSPMTAHIEREWEDHIWFFTSRLGSFALLGDATGAFVAKDHAVFARFQGVLSEETDREIFDRHYSRAVQAWFPGTRDDPNLMLVRMSLGEASIWSIDEFGLFEVARTMLGRGVCEHAEPSHVAMWN